MRSKMLPGAVVCLLIGAAAFLPAGCSSDATCDPTKETCTSTSQPPPPPGCDLGADSPVGDQCAIFVSYSRGIDTNNGTVGYAPLRTFDKAMELSAKMALPIVVCAEEFPEGTTVPSGVVLHGGYDCSSMNQWVYRPGQKTVLTAPPGRIAVKFASGGETTRLEDFELRGADGVMPGQSSIAASAVKSQVELVNCTIVAGRGADGADGESLAADPALDGTPGKAGAAACVDASPNPGGGAVYKTCLPNLASIGGSGGDGGTTAGAGGDGKSGGPAGGGAGGKGQPTAGAWSCNTTGNGQPGGDGSAGTAGVGAKITGSIGIDGYSPTDGTKGTNGVAGYAGGGGGGAKGGAICASGGMSYGAAGGSGGSGGCGGRGGGGGGGGGASIGLLSINSTIKLQNCKITTAGGGNGGAGGNGQPGGFGGASGKGAAKPVGGAAGCDGGAGGDGGKGGPGGGGAGGPSIGIAHAGTAPVLDATVSFEVGPGGKGGPGGDNGGASNGGADADTKETLAL
jgi:hypothetical protein